MLTRPVFKDDSDVVRISKPWFVHQTERHGLLLCFSGMTQDSDSSRWVVQRRIEPFKVEAEPVESAMRPREIEFDGPFDAAEMALAGASVDMIATFRQGFPENWDSVWPRPPPPPPQGSPPRARKTRRMAKEDESERIIQENSQDGEIEHNGHFELRRSKRQKENEERPCYDEDDLLLRALRKEEAKDHVLEIFGLKEESLSEGEEGDGDEELNEDDWTADENTAFQQARLLLNPASPDFWDRMSQQFVETRSAEECQEKWLREAAAPSSKSRLGRGKHDSTTTGVFSEEDAMKREERAAKMGTVKFRKQVREDWERVHRKDSRARVDQGLTTPFRSKIESDVLPQSCCKDVVTPVQTFHFGESENQEKLHLSVLYEESEESDDDDEDENDRGAERRQLRGMMKAAQSPDVLIEVNRDNLDGYLIGLVKEKKKLQNLKTKNPNKASDVRKGNVTLQQRYQNMISMTQAETEGVQGVLTPGGSVKLKVDKDMFRSDGDEEDQELENRRRRGIAEGDDDEYWT